VYDIFYADVTYSVMLFAQISVLIYQSKNIPEIKTKKFLLKYDFVALPRIVYSCILRFEMHENI